jgi:hypothetical protein
MNSICVAFRGVSLLFVASFAAGGLAACGDDSPNTAGTAVGGSASSAGGSASSAGGSTASTGSNPLTNLPANAKTTIQNTSAGTGLQLVSLNLVPDPTSSINYVEWFGEVKNTGNSLVCFPKVTFAFLDTTGQSLWTGTAFADTKPYAESSLSTSCLASGESGAFWSNDLPSLPLRVSSVGQLTASLDGLVISASQFSYELTTSIVQDSIYVDNNHWAMSGSFRPSQTVDNVLIAGYTKAASGLLTGRLTATNLDTVAAHTTWTFNTTIGIEGPRPASIIAYPDFIISETSAMIVGLPDAAPPSRLDPTLSAAAAERRENRQAAEARWLLARP